MRWGTRLGCHVDRAARGHHLILCLSVFCGSCEYCLIRRPNLCRNPERMRAPNDPPKFSWSGSPVNQFAQISSFAEYMLVHENALVKIPLDRDASVAFRRVVEKIV